MIMRDELRVYPAGRREGPLHTWTHLGDSDLGGNFDSTFLQFPFTSSQSPSLPASFLPSPTSP
jgi:hypothetical protein